MSLSHQASRPPLRYLNSILPASSSVPSLPASSPPDHPRLPSNSRYRAYCLVIPRPLRALAVEGTLDPIESTIVVRRRKQAPSTSMRGSVGVRTSAFGHGLRPSLCSGECKGVGGVESGTPDEQGCSKANQTFSQERIARPFTHQTKWSRSAHTVTVLLAFGRLLGRLGGSHFVKKK